jgi:DNA-binding CsgD family transcriptional regulator
MGRVPWRKIATFLESLEAEPTLDGVLERALASLQPLVGHDFSVAAYARSDFARFKSLRSRDAPDSLIAQYLLFYHRLDRWLPRYRQHPLQRIAWRFQRRGEFRSWILESGIRHSLGISDLSDGREQGFLVGLLRHGHHWFSEQDKTVIAAVQPHLSYFVDAVVRPELAQARRLQETGAAAGLTPREQEVAALLAMRLPTPEIAERLYISRHTVEKHLEHIYLKLRTTDRAEARRQLLGEADARLLASPWQQWLVSVQ